MTDPSFLPDDYLAHKAEQRTNIICLTLFGVVMIAVVGAFFVTNRQWSELSVEQERIKLEYSQAAAQIKDLQNLEQQREQMLNKAEIAAALVERVPRSILLAELINRMPPRLSLLSLELQSEKIKTITPTANDSKSGVGRHGKPKRAPTREEAADSAQKIEAPRYLVTLEMTGVAPTDLEVSRYMAELNAYGLIESIKLKKTEEKEIEEQLMRQFELAMTLNMSADVRTVDPLIKPRDLRDPLSDDLYYGDENAKGAISAAPIND